MKGRIYWGLATLIILLIGVSAVLLMRNTDTEQGEKVSLPEPKGEEPHHEVKISEADNNGKNAQIAQPVEQDVQVSQPPITQTHTGPLTYHAELLKTNPVKALRLQTEERGHWSAEWVPPFPPDDTEAQEFARARYLLEYYHHNFGDLLDTPGYEKEAKEYDKAYQLSR